MSQQTILDLAQKAADDATAAILRTLRLLDNEEDVSSALAMVTGALLYGATSTAADRRATAEMALAYALTTIVACTKLYGIQDMPPKRMSAALEAVSATAREYFKAAE